MARTSNVNATITPSDLTMNTFRVREDGSIREGLNDDDDDERVLSFGIGSRWWSADPHDDLDDIAGQGLRVGDAVTCGCAEAWFLVSLGSCSFLPSSDHW